MTDTAGDKPPFPGFPGFPPAEMLDKMWDMMRMTPFGAAFPGMQPGAAQGFPSPLTAMSDMMSPLMSVEELDKRITDLRAVEQWLKLNLNMLQSTIQGMEVQRATLSTLRAFGAFAQASMTQPAPEAGPASAASPWGTSASAEGSRTANPSATSPSSASGEAAGAGDSASKGAEAPADATSSGAAESPAFDPSAWWNLLQSQFNQLAAFAMTQPGAGADGEAGAASSGSQKKAAADGPAAPGAKRAASPAGSQEASAKPAAKRAPARKSPAKPAGGSGTGSGA
jgi:hypothetical protein